MNEQIAIIYWKDACKNGPDSVHLSDVKDLGLMDLISVGLVLYEDDNCITLGTDMSEQYKNVRDVNVYPKSGISKIIKRSITELTATNPVKKEMNP